MNFGLPQIIYLGLVSLSLGIQIANHGKPRSNENAWAGFIGICITIGLLYWGGFFK